MTFLFILTVYVNTLCFNHKIIFIAIYAFTKNTSAQKQLNNDLNKILTRIQSRFNFDKDSTIGFICKDQKRIKVVRNVKELKLLQI